MILDLTETCVESTFWPEFKSITMHILNQRTNKISGIAKQCKKLKIQTNTYKTFLGYETTTTNTEVMELTREDCLAMILTKKCGNMPMSCHDSNCYYQSDPKLEYQWLSQRE